ncbi:MAG: Clp protease N-terminal domain-containing protein, partial [Chloroflexota bacterium]
GTAADGPSGAQVQPRVGRTVVDPDTKQRFATYSLRARQVLIAALEEAVKRGRGAVDQENLLGGIAVVEASAGLAILGDLGISQGRLQGAVETAFPPDLTANPMAADRGQPDNAGAAQEVVPLRLAERAERTLTLAEEEVRSLGHRYVGVEHLLLGLVLEGTGPGSELLARLGVTPPTARAAFHRFLDTPAHRTWLGTERPEPSGE